MEDLEIIECDTAEIKKKPYKGKKNWRKKWVKIIDENEFWIKMWKILNYHTIGKSVITHPANIDDEAEAGTPLTLIQACREVGMSYHTFRFHLNSMPEMKAQYEVMKEQSVEYKNELSENLIEKALTWKLKTLSEKDVVDTAKWTLEKTNKRYNPKHVIEAQVEVLNIERSSEDILSDIADIISK